MEIKKLLISAELRSQIRSQSPRALQLAKGSTSGEKEQDNVSLAAVKGLVCVTAQSQLSTGGEIKNCWPLRFFCAVHEQ